MIPVKAVNVLSCDRIADGVPCETVFMIELADVDVVRKAAAERGWTITDIGDYCPRHGG